MAGAARSHHGLPAETGECQRSQSPTLPNWHDGLLGREGDDPFPGQLGDVRDRGSNCRLGEGWVLADQLLGGKAGREISSTTDTGILVPAMHGTPPMISALALMYGCQSMVPRLKQLLEF